jgi:hypothetical protein
MASRKIFNFESKVLDQETFDKYGYDPSKGGCSKKKVLASCRFCGKSLEVLMSNFKKQGSACHLECYRKEMSIAGSPFLNKEVRDKAKETNKEKYGSEYASQNKEIANKISEAVSDPEYQKAKRERMIDKIGFSNVFQSPEVKEKIKNTMMNTYGQASPINVPEIKNKIKKTIKDKYGVDNISQNKHFQEKRLSTLTENYGGPSYKYDINKAKESIGEFYKTIENDTSGHYSGFRSASKPEFWEDLKSGMTLYQLATKYNIAKDCIGNIVHSPKFADDFKKYYKYPRLQKQQEVREAIMKMGFIPKFNDRSIISPLELDIYIPEKNFAIEFNGSYWHSEARLSHKKAKYIHLNKTKLCKEKGIRLFHLFEHDWMNKKEQTLNFLKSCLGISSIKIHARKCKINNDEIKSFIDSNHMQGGLRANVIKYFNLIHEGEIVGCTTASRHHRQNITGKPIVLSRMCFKDGILVNGGANKMFSQFKEWAKSEGYDRIISWSDNKWTEGNVYSKMGFTLEKESRPDYFYYDHGNEKYVSKQSQQKKLVNCPEGMTESEWAKERGLYKIWDVGKKLWVYKL